MQRIAIFFLVLPLMLSALYADNMVANGQFESWQDEKPESWVVRSKQAYSPYLDQDVKPPVRALKVQVVKPEGGYGEILQKVSVEKNTNYRLSGSIRSTLSGQAFLQVKRYGNGREIDRANTSRSDGPEWKDVTYTFPSDGAEYVEVLLRWKQKHEDIGSEILFRDLSLEKMPPYRYEGEEVPPRAVPTFNSVGLYWKPTGGTGDRRVRVSYRTKGSSEWSEALPLWFDATQHYERVAERIGEYRGSIVYLKPGTAYEAKLELEDGPTRVVEFETWDENFKIARTVTLPAEYDGKYNITDGGSPEEGYVLYEPEPGHVAWDVNGQLQSNLEIHASWVIVRGLTLKGAGKHGIILGDVTHVVIDDCDISGWGGTREDGQAYNIHSAIFSQSKLLENIVIQNCNLHHPRSDSNSWAEKRPGTNSSHPEGPQGITFRGGEGQYVIRYNRIHSDMEHMFNDGMGELSNFGYGGFPNRDSDIHDNFVSHCWDDGLEIEGADMNVRVWNNYVDHAYGAIGAAVSTLGPVYYFRNVFASSRKSSGMTSNDLRGAYLIKLGNEQALLTRGAIYAFHNTALQPPGYAGTDMKSSGAGSGIIFTSNKKLQQNIMTRNNLIQTRSDKNWAIKDTQLTWSNDFDYDMYNGRLMVRDGSEANGIRAYPTYERAPDGRLWLVPGTAGHDAGVRIPNFNDDFVGAQPDMGAVETHTHSPKPIHWPIFPENYTPPQEDSVTAADPDAACE